MKLGKIRALVIILSAIPSGIAAAQSQFADRADTLLSSVRDTLTAPVIPSAASLQDTVAVPMPDAPMQIAIPILEAASSLTDTQKLALADSLHGNYQFRRAIQLCDELISESPDSLVRVYAAELLSNSESGFDFTSTVAVPTVIARQKFTLRDFSSTTLSPTALGMTSVRARVFATVFRRCLPQRLSEFFRTSHIFRKMTT